MLTFSRDHADSPASPLLSGSLVAARDAITGHWAGNITVDRTAGDLQAALETDYLDKLRLPYQALVLDCLLKGRISVTGGGGSAAQASLRMRRASSSIERPC